MLTIVTALRLEQRAVRRAGVADAALLRCGLSARRLPAGPGAAPLTGPVAVTGVCGAVGEGGLAPGDVVVATELRNEATGSATPVPSAPLLAATLRRRGLTVHLGPLVTARRPVLASRRRAELARSGAIAVDMESAIVAARTAGPVAAVRVVVDTPAAGLFSTGTVRHGPAALRSLTAATPALADWAGVMQSRRVLLASPRSFCAGVERAIDIVERALAQRGAPVYVRKQIVHNSHVVADLERRGAVFVEDTDEVPPGATVVFSAHGVSPAVRAAADGHDLDVIDATCPLVAKVHAEARRFVSRGDTVLLIGHGGHEEVEGTLGEAPDGIRLVETVDDARRVDVPRQGGVAYLMQTTLAVDEATAIADVLRERFPAMAGPRSDDICYATSNRQDAVRAVAREADLLLVVGSVNSSNSRRLVEVSERLGTPAQLVDDATEIDLAWLRGAGTVAVTAGASAPPRLVDGVIAALGGLGPVTVDERPVGTENVHFTLPKEVS